MHEREQALAQPRASAVGVDRNGGQVTLEFLDADRAVQDLLMQATCVLILDLTEGVADLRERERDKINRDNKEREAERLTRFCSSSWATKQ